MYKRILLCSTLSFSSFVVWSGQEVQRVGWLPQPVVVLHWHEDGKEREFNVRTQEAKFIQEYIVPLVLKLSGCQQSGSQWAHYTSIFGAVGAAGFSWYAGISDKASEILKQNGLESVSWLGTIAPVLIGGLAYFALKPLLKRGYTLLFLANERSRWRLQIKNEIENMRGSSWQLVKKLVQGILSLRNLVGVRFWRLKYALNETLKQGGCSDEMKCKLFGFDQASDCTKEFVHIMQRLLDIHPLNLIANPQGELRSFVLGICNNA